MTDGPSPTANNPPVPVGKVRGAKAAKPAASAPVPAAKPRGMSYGGISAAQHALERLERANRLTKNGRRI